MYVNKAHIARGFYFLFNYRLLRVADSSICVTNQLEQLQVREFCDERAMFTNDQNCPVLNIKI